MKKNGFSSIFLITLIILALFLVVITILLLFEALYKLLNQKVDYIIAVSSMLGNLLILITLITAFWYNKKTFKNFDKSQKQSKNQFEEERRQLNAQFQEQQKFLQKQQFDSTFFNMIKQLEDIVSKLSLADKRGREVFDFFYKFYKGKNYNCYILEFVNNSVSDLNFSHIHKDNDDLTSLIYEFNKEYKNIIPETFNRTTVSKSKYIEYKNGIQSLINNFGILGYETSENINILDHYFRYLYRIIRFIDEAEFLEKDNNFIDERYKYTSILRATLSPYELVFLFYNGLSEYGNEKVKPLIEKYSILKNIREALTANSSLDKDLGNFIDNCENDYYRYNVNEKILNDRYNYSAFYKDKSLHSNEEHKNINRKDLVNEICDLHNTIMENIQDNYLIYISDFEKKVIELNNEFRPKYLNDNIIYHITKKLKYYGLEIHRLDSD